MALVVVGVRKVAVGAFGAWVLVPQSKSASHSELARGRRDSRLAIRVSRGRRPLTWPAGGFGVRKVGGWRIWRMGTS